MEFNESEIMKVVAAEENAGGFPALIQKFKKLGIIKYDFLVESGVYVFSDLNTTITLPLNGTPHVVSATASKENLRAAVKKAQSGLIDFGQFCKLSGEAGILNWRAELDKMEVTYFDREGNIMLKEPIPVVTD